MHWKSNQLSACQKILQLRCVRTENNAHLQYHHVGTKPFCLTPWTERKNKIVSEYNVGMGTHAYNKSTRDICYKPCPLLVFRRRSHLQTFHSTPQNLAYHPIYQPFPSFPFFMNSQDTIPTPILKPLISACHPFVEKDDFAGWRGGFRRSQAPRETWWDLYKSSQLVSIIF